eukprot:gnl/TRDRNA2_/TRDRNA2_34923_c0_seq1.p1 gnl/TRDRNA2_/TRDRNA2_34923_c0~~gnl/TRDRNA2_/TRDRNA2_34923_c0_seq1.p1  ORF type:complete len:456 (-),score=65.20 gnl/TRDRNA2_/TRDRNA2_34923_c0_seq1:5-1372(-)
MSLSRCSSAPNALQLRPASAPHALHARPEVALLKSRFERCSVAPSDGRLSKQQLSTLLRKGRPDFTQRELRGLFACVSADRSGRIPFGEFVDFVAAPHPNVLIIADPGPDPDDVKVLLLAATLQLRGMLTVKGVVANGGHQARERATLAKTVLRLAGAPNIRVGIGTAGVARAPQPHEYRLAGFDENKDTDLEEGHELILDVLRGAAPGSLTIQCQSGLTDAARAMREEAELFCRKVARLAIQGGLFPATDGALDGAWLPDQSQNNVFDIDSASFVYNFCLQHKIPMHVVGKDAVPDLPMSLAVRFAQSGCPLMGYLCDCQRLGLVQLWGKVCAGNELPPRCTKEWFFCTFCGANSAEFKEKYSHLGADCDITDYLNGSVKPYDLVAFMTILPRCAEAFDFAGAAVEIHGVQHFLFLKKDLSPPVSAIVDLLSDVYTSVVQLHKTRADFSQPCNL